MRLKKIILLFTGVMLGVQGHQMSGGMALEDAMGALTMILRIISAHHASLLRVADETGNLPNTSLGITVEDLMVKEITGLPPPKSVAPPKSMKGSPQAQPKKPEPKKPEPPKQSKQSSSKRSHKKTKSDEPAVEKAYVFNDLKLGLNVAAALQKKDRIADLIKFYQNYCPRKGPKSKDEYKLKKEIDRLKAIKGN